MKCKFEKCTNQIPKIETGRRPKEYCSSSCRQKDYRIRKKAEIINLKSELQELKSGMWHVKDAITIIKEQKQEAIVSNNNAEILEQIKALELEKMPAYIKMDVAKKSWLNDQKKKINQLKSQLK